MPAKSTDISKLVWGTNAERLGASYVEAGVVWFETDTADLYIRVVNALGNLAWEAMAGAASAGWDKYVVYNGGVPGPTVLYTTIASAIAAAVADGCGPAKPAVVLVMPGVYAENLTLRTGIHLAAIGGGGGQNASPEVLISGTQTVFDLSGTLTLDGIQLSSSGVPLTVAGADAIVVELLRSRVDATDGTDRCVDFTNTNSASRLVARDSYLIADAAAPNVVRLTNAGFQTYDTTFAAGGTNVGCLNLAPAITGDVIGDGCDITGTITKSGVGSTTLRRIRIAATPVPNVIGELCTWFVDGDIISPNGLSYSTGATVTVRRVTRPNPRTTLSGAGPHSVLASHGSTVALNPGANVTLVATLPDTSTFTEGDEIAFVVQGTGLGSAVATLGGAGGQQIGGVTAPRRLYEGGHIALRCNRAGSGWDVVAYAPGNPEILQLFAANAGSDDNAGTSASPVRTLQRAMQLAFEAPWHQRATISLVGAYTDDPNPTSTTPTIAIPGPVSDGGSPLLIQGTYANVAGFPAKVPTGSSAGSAGPPVIFPRATFGADATYAADAARGYHALYSAGPYAGQLQLVDASDSTFVEHPGTGVAPGLNQFQLQEPQAALDSAFEIGFVPGTGAELILDAVSLQPSASSPLLVGAGATVWLNGCRVNSDVSVGSGAAVLLGQVSNVAPAQVFAGLTQAWITAYSLTTRGTYVAGVCSVGAGGYLEFGASCVGKINGVGGISASEAVITFLVSATAVAQSGALQAETCVAYAPVVVANGGSAVIDGLTTQHANGTGLIVSQRAFAQLTGVQGTLSAGGSYGVDADGGARVYVTDPAPGGTEVTGAAGDVRVGVLGAKTWAQIAAGAVADCLEIAGAGAAGTSVGA